MSSEYNLIQANALGHTIAGLLAQPKADASNVSQAVNGLVMSMIAKAQECLNPLTVKTSSPAAGVDSTMHTGTEKRSQLTDSGLAAYTGHASDCATNNRGVPEMVGDCDCGAGLTLQSYFKDNLARGVIDFSLRSCQLPGGEVGFYLHPARTDGHTPQFTVKGNVLTTHTPA